MIDAREPKNGDFASYVEGLVGQAPGAVPARKRVRTPFAHAGANRRRVLPGNAAMVQQAPAATPNHQVAAATGHGNGPSLLAKASTLATVAGVVVLVLSFAGPPSHFADPAAGIVLLGVGIVLRRFARKSPR